MCNGTLLDAYKYHNSGSFSCIVQMMELMDVFERSQAGREHTRSLLRDEMEMDEEAYARIQRELASTANPADSSKEDDPERGFTVYQASNQVRDGLSTDPKTDAIETESTPGATPSERGS